MSDKKSPSAGDVDAQSGSKHPHAQKSSQSSPVVVGLTLIVVLGILLVIGINKRVNHSTAGSDEIAQLQAEADALRAAHDMRTDAGSSVAGESVSQIADRMKKDTESLVALIHERQNLLGQKLDQLAARDAEVLAVNDANQTLSAENATLKTELEEALADRAGFESMRREFAEIKSQREAISVELADVQRRLDETLRVKNFFEARAKQLEQDAAAGK